MSRVKFAADFGESRATRKISTELLASAQSCARRLQLSLEGLGGVSNVLALAGLGAGLVAARLAGAMIDRGLAIAVDLK
jgi:hypothetical protein